MKRKLFNRNLAVVAAVLTGSVLLFTSPSRIARVSASSGRYNKTSLTARDERTARQLELKVRLATTNSRQFRDALAALEGLDEPGALNVWRAALNNSDPSLQREAWNRYRSIQSELERKEFVPQVARINASSDEVLQLARSSGLDVTIWSARGDQTFAAVPEYLIGQLRDAGINTNVIYDSVADWQRARANGDVLAQSITPVYQSADALSSTQMRIAVIDTADRSTAAPGYSDWVGDPEDIVMRDGTRVAYLDIFSSDGSPASIEAHTREHYTRRGYKLSGFFTPEEFADIAPRMFPGKSFEAGRRMKPAGSGDLHIALANGKFHSYDQTVTEFKALAASNPSLARYTKLGSSFEGRDIFALKISKDVSTDDASKPDVLITGCHHAREWISVESPVYFANQLLSGYTTDDSIKYLVDHLQIWIVPIVNPDGLNFTQNVPSGQSDPARLWRKNRRPLSFGSCLSSVGVDLNRNYNYEWRLQGDTACTDYCSSDRSCISDDIGASDDPQSEIYRGPQPESEPEVRAIKSLVDDPNRHFRAQVDYHNYSQLILYPWGYAPFGTDDAKTLSTLAQRMSDDLFGVDRVLYKPEQAVDLYALTGSSIDYAYGVNHVPAPFVVEMRPFCCDFDVPESEIPAVNQENWAAARSLLNWAAGPPILESVRAYTPSGDGTFSKLIYSAHWVASPDDPAHRQMVVDTKFPGIDPGRLQVKLQFSRPMNSSLSPRATLGRDSQLDEVSLSAVTADEGWQKTVYSNDTWVGETVIVADDNITSLWTVAVSATDPLGFMLDALPATIASYTAGISHWQNYEDSTGQGSDGGIDTQNAIGPGVRSNFPNILVASPNGGERLAGGDDYNVAWTAPNVPGSAQSLSLSTDGGNSFSLLAGNIASSSQRFIVTLPRVSTTRGRLRLLVVEPVFHNSTFAMSQADFTIGSNVNSNVDITFLASERMDLNWSDTSSDDPPVTASGASRLAIDIRITNSGSTPILNPFLHVAELNKNVLLTRDAKSSWGVTARQTIDAGSDNVLSPGESADARLVVGLITNKKFFLSVDLYGVPSSGTILSSNPTNIWSGKPRTR